MAEEIIRSTMTLNDLTQQYHSLKIGETVELTVNKLEKVDNVGEKFSLAGETFRYEIRDINNKTLSISSWKLFGALRKTFKETGKIEGVKLKIAHIGTGQYAVEVVQQS